MYYAIIGIVAFAIGVLISYALWSRLLKSKYQKAIKEAEAEAEVIKKERILQAKEKFLQMKSEHEKAVNERNSRIVQSENKLKQRENQLNQKLDDLQRKHKEADTVRESLNAQKAMADKRNEELERVHREQIEKLEQMSGLSAEEAKNQLVESLKDEAKTAAMSYINEIVDEAKMTANRRPKRLW